MELSVIITIYKNNIRWRMKHKNKFDAKRPATVIKNVKLKKTLVYKVDRGRNHIE